MEQIIKKTIGSTVHTFVVSGENLYDVVTESQKLSFPDVECCGKCGSKDLVLGSHLGKDDKGNMSFKYVDIKCMNPDCRASLTFGQPRKDPNTFYLRKNEDKEYDWKEFKSETTNQGNQGTPPASNQATKPATHNNNTHKTQSAPDQKAKPSNKALDYATKIATAKTLQGLTAICNAVKGIEGFNDTDKQYLNAECTRKRNLLTASHAEQVG